MANLRPEDTLSNSIVNDNLLLRNNHIPSHSDFSDLALPAFANNQMSLVLLASALSLPNLRDQAQALSEAYKLLSCSLFFDNLVVASELFQLVGSGGNDRFPLVSNSTLFNFLNMPMHQQHCLTNFSPAVSRPSEADHENPVDMPINLTTSRKAQERDVTLSCNEDHVFTLSKGSQQNDETLDQLNCPPGLQLATVNATPEAISNTCGTCEDSSATSSIADSVGSTSNGCSSFAIRHSRKSPKRVHRLWQFLWNLLDDPTYNPSIIRWINKAERMFELTKSSAVANLWGAQKQKLGMSYENLGRSLRYYYSRNILRKVSGQRLVYQFLPTSALQMFEKAESSR